MGHKLRTVAFRPAIPLQSARGLEPIPRRTSVVRAAVALVVTMALAAIGFAILDPATGPAIAGAGRELARLLWLMALVKAAMAAGATALVGWRLGHPASPRLAAGYAGAAGMMAAGPALIGGIAHFLAGAALFHAGLGLLLVLGCVDRDGPWLPRWWRGTGPPGAA